MKRVPIYSVSEKNETGHRMMDIILDKDEDGKIVIETKNKANGVLRVGLDDLLRVIDHVFKTDYHKAT